MLIGNHDKHMTVSREVPLNVRGHIEYLRDQAAEWET